MPTITFSGLASGLDTSSWVEALVSVKQMTVTSLQATLDTIQTKQSKVSTLQASFTSLRASVEKLTDAKFGTSMDLFATNTVVSSNEDAFTATVNKNAARQSYNIQIEQLATTTSTSSDKSVGAIADEDTDLSVLGIKAGTFTVYVDKVKQTIDIDSDDTMGKLKDKLSAVGVNAEIDSSGHLVLSAADSSSSILVGTTNDTSNLKSIAGLNRQTDGSYKSSSAMYKVTTSSKVTESNIFTTGEIDGEGNPINTTVTEGTFKIGNATFTIDGNTTISGLISKINSNEDAGVTAYWDNASSKLVLNSNIEGHSYINIEAGTSNFTDVMGLTESVWNDGVLETTALRTENQTLGVNAIMYVNGTKVVSSSNTVTSDISRLDGITINLKKVTNEEEDGVSTLSVEQDTSALVSALTDFVDKYNSVMTSLDNLTASDGELYGETTLNTIKRSLRQLVTSSTGDSGDTFTLLKQIGISTADVGADLSADTSSLSLDVDVLKQALAENSDAVKKVILGTSSAQDGILSKLENVLDNSLSTSGYFTTTLETIKDKITKYNTKISTQNTRIASYKSNLEAKFEAMEKSISSMQSAYSDLLTSSSSS